MRHRRSLLLLVAVAVAGLLLTACGGSDPPEVANLGEAAETTADGETTEAPTDPEEAMLAYTECMRENGVDLPDPEFGGPGQSQGDDEEGEGPRFQFGPGGEIDPNDPDFQQAQEACQSLLANIQGRFDPEMQEQFQDAALEFAQCMRDEGFDFPDPEFGEGPGGGGFGLFQQGGDGLDPNDPDVQAAMEACQEQAFGDLPGPGGPGGGPPPAQDGES